MSTLSIYMTARDTDAIDKYQSVYDPIFSKCLPYIIFTYILALAIVAQSSFQSELL